MTNERNETIAAVATGTGGAVALIRSAENGPCRSATRCSEAYKESPVYAERIYDPLRNDSRRRSRYRRSADLSFPRSALLYGRGHDRNIVPRLRLHSSPRDGIGNPARRSTARPGEFTLRAFLAGKMDLSQAEAVADVIASDNRAAHDLAFRQMRGGYSDEFGQLRENSYTSYLY